MDIDQREIMGRWRWNGGGEGALKGETESEATWLDGVSEVG
jgi:hypothetical protein